MMNRALARFLFLLKSSIVQKATGQTWTNVDKRGQFRTQKGDFVKPMLLRANFMIINV
ncbi:hypothetical protein [uncultured Empedobacter sp.]|uniref:hypothetical protein n=1 Tax=uncultured Empedobacter sp. TaxID=410844 RepID=UPI00261BC7FD|nr:hypothetical protein [uncultured Empedobacter sp.]